MQMTFAPQTLNAPGKWKTARVYFADGEKTPDAILVRDNQWRLASSDKSLAFSRQGWRGFKC